ncbi:glycosyltransferase family 2 protein [Roseococcus sp. SDR]|uniref:glycosyltransferase family 2 protein n=1 Tax=Roseococcus sp. SDR TaxID=2835532 RepID=UPI001BD0A2D8|nr:glycosyltransferase family 2 protein [Roseococcus sp. SDR]MBS7792775.1 glycosyltransferase family 2 protein [Roseococcus sp. SDR]MBV1848089.1 glycosyltransferase family 2 protein [Roseococcus sp. SDR]
MHAEMAPKRMDGSAETREANPDIMPPAGGEVRPMAGDAGLIGWAEPDPLSPEAPPEIGLDVEGGSTRIVTAAPPRDSQGRFRLSWSLPHSLRDGVTRRVRAFHMISGRELDGSPVTLAAPPLPAALPVEAPEEAPAVGLRWPDGLAVTRAATGLLPIAEGMLAEAMAPAAHLRSELLADLAEGPDALRRGVRLLADVVAPAIRLYLRLDAADGPVPAGHHMEREVTAWLPEATEAHVKARFDVTLERREGPAFHTLRRLRRGTLFRRPTDHPVSFELTAEEAALLAEGNLWLGLAALSAKGLSARLPGPAPDPLAQPARFEDARLDGAFAHAVGFVRVHGEARREAHPLLPGLWQAPPPLAQAARPAAQAHPFTQVILPVYNGHDEVRACLHALRAAATGPMQVVMVDDGSRDFTAEMLRAEAAADPRFILHRRDINRGYTKSINEGVLLTGADWVVVLNSDTLVSKGWLDRLHAAAQARPGTGMVGPLSNAATWQSIPAAKRPDGAWSTNALIEPRHLERLQAILDEVSERAYPEFPVLNGFCTLIARAVFDRVGLYDEDAFPTGYGEETDLCLRARQAGFRLTLADDCFVFHHKSVTFGQVERTRLSRQGGLEMTNKHSGVIVPALERIMQDCAPLGRLRARLSNLAAELN